MDLKNGKVFRSKSVGTGPSSYEKKYAPGRGLTKVEKQCCRLTIDVSEDHAVSIFTVQWQEDKKY
jgi:hypothetical protein